MMRSQVLAVILLVVPATAAFAPTPRVAFTSCHKQQLRPLSMSLMSTEENQTEERTKLGIVTYSKAVDPVTSNEKEEPLKEQSETEKLLAKVKAAGTAGVVSYALWELAFWFISIPVCLVGYQQVTGHWPDLSNADDQAKLGAEAFAFVNVARFAVPLRIGLALGTTPWIQENIVDKFMNRKDADTTTTTTTTTTTDGFEPMMNDDSTFNTEKK
jgi:hypothetical protein